MPLDVMNITTGWASYLSYALIAIGAVAFVITMLLYFFLIYRKKNHKIITINHQIYVQKVQKASKMFKIFDVKKRLIKSVPFMIILIEFSIICAGLIILFINVKLF